MCKNLMCSSDDCEVPYGLCHCGCGGVVNISPKNNTKRGFIKGEYFKHIKNHNKRKSPVDYIINAETGCWEWQRGKGPMNMDIPILMAKTQEHINTTMSKNMDLFHQI